MEITTPPEPDRRVWRRARSSIMNNSDACFARRARSAAGGTIVPASGYRRRPAHLRRVSPEQSRGVRVRPGGWPDGERLRWHAGAPLRGLRAPWCVVLRRGLRSRGERTPVGLTVPGAAGSPAATCAARRSEVHARGGGAFAGGRGAVSRPGGYPRTNARCDPGRQARFDADICPRCGAHPLPALRHLPPSRRSRAVFPAHLSRRRQARQTHRHGDCQPLHAAEAAAPQGVPAQLPPVPHYPEGWQLGTPDMTIRMPKPFAIAADGPDQYMCFDIPLHLTADKYVRALEFRPEARSVVHHALFLLDSGHIGRQLGESYSCFGTPGFLP